MPNAGRAGVTRIAAQVLACEGPRSAFRLRPVRVGPRLRLGPQYRSRVHAVMLV